MKCSLCDGKGKYINGLGVVSRCYYCLGTGKVNDKGERNMTNEEWFCTLSTEEKAKWIATQCGNAVMESTYDVSKLRKKRYWVEWLKQPHTTRS